MDQKMEKNKNKTGLVLENKDGKGYHDRFWMKALPLTG